MNTATETPAGKTRGQIAYEAYCEATNWKSLANGSALPQWPEVKDKIKEAWEKSAAALVAALPAAETEAAEVLRKIEVVFDQAGVKKENAGLTYTLAGRAIAVVTELKSVEQERDEAGKIAKAHCDQVNAVAAFLREHHADEFPKFPTEQDVADVVVLLCQDRDEIMARIMNALDVKEGGFPSVLVALDALKAAALEAQTKKAPFDVQGMSIKRTGRLIEVRLAETGEVEQHRLDALVGFLKQSGLGSH